MADTLRDAVAVGDILRTAWPVRFDHHLPLYLGSGRCGASFDAWGLLHGSPTKGPTALMHADHWHRGAFGLDYWLPVARLRWAGVEPSPPVAYRQELRLHDACLETRLAWPDRTVRFRAWFHPGDPDVLAVEVSHETAAGGTMPRLLLAP